MAICGKLDSLYIVVCSEMKPGRFMKAENTLINSNDEFEKLRLLYCSVPPNYIAHPDNYSPSLNDDGGPSTSG